MSLQQGDTRRAYATATLMSFMLLAAPAIAHPQPAQSQAQIQTGDPSIAVKYRRKILVPEYGGYVDVYDNVPAVGAGPNSGFHAQYFYMPFPIVDLARARQDFQGLKWSGDGLQRLVLPLHVTFLDEQVAQTIASALGNDDAGKPISPADVVPVPINELDVWAEIFGQKFVIYNEPKVEDTYFAHAVMTLSSEAVNAELVATKSGMERFLANPIIGARGLVASANVTTSAISWVSRVLMNDDFQNTLQGNGALNQSSQFSSTQGGVGLAVPVLGGSLEAGNNELNARQSSTMSRYVSRRFVLNALQSTSASTDLHTFTDDPNSHADFQKTLDLMLDYALKSMTRVEAEFKRTADGKYQMFTGPTFSDAIGQKMSLSDLETQSKLDDKLDSDLEHKVTYKGVEASDVDKINQEANSDIMWKAQGNILVPSTVDLYLYQSQSFSSSLSAAVVENEATYSTTPFLAGPAAIEGPGVASDQVPTAMIGQIIASTVLWDAQSDWFHQHWLPADGRPVDHTTEYFALLAPKTSAGAPDSTAVVTVPDLRGIFLRGMNDFGAGRAPSTKDPYAQEHAGKARVAGQDEEEDAIRQEVDSIANTGGDLNNFVRRTGGDPGNGDHFSPRDAGGSYSGHALQVTVGEGSETRPVNRAVYYYIRVN
jgi:hypothetical protein